MISLFQVNITNTFWQSSKAQTSSMIQSPQTMISRILPNIYSIASILLLIYVIYAGFLYISSSGDQEKVKKSRTMLTNAFVGFLIIFGSYWIIQAVEVISGINIL
jgi:heme/copper-type cytochrome/quinol oxidase subunit 4